MKKRPPSSWHNTNNGAARCEDLHRGAAFVAGSPFPVSRRGHSAYRQEAMRSSTLKGAER